MAIRPFGRPFEIRSPLRPVQAKSAIRALLTSWLDMREGARGVIAGPCLILWPRWDQALVLIARVSRDGSGCRVAGRADLDPGGWAVVASGAALIGFLAWRDAVSLNIGLVGLGLLAATILLWSRQALSREDDMLVPFLEEAIRPPSAPLRASLLTGDIPAEFRLLVSGRPHSGPVTLMDLRHAIEGMEANDVLVLEGGAERYIQAVRRLGGFRIEMRQGDGRHFEAVRLAGPASSARAVLSLEDALLVAAAHARQIALPPDIVWRATVT